MIYDIVDGNLEETLQQIERGESKITYQLSELKDTPKIFWGRQSKYLACWGGRFVNILKVTDPEPKLYKSYEVDAELYEEILGI